MFGSLANFPKDVLPALRCLITFLFCLGVSLRGRPEDLLVPLVFPSFTKLFTTEGDLSILLAISLDDKPISTPDIACLRPMLMNTSNTKSIHFDYLCDAM